MNPYRTAPPTPRERRRFAWLNLLLLALVVALFTALGACTDAARQIQAQTANGIAVGANADLQLLVDAYRHEGLDAIAAAKTREEATSGLDTVKKTWAPRWAAWEAVRIAHDAWATALEKGLDVTSALASLRAAYCELVGVWPAAIPAMPVVPVQCGGAK